ncbi:hypothetical protein JCM11641_003460 [Rhodosporidiobolus odoratus]
MRASTVDPALFLTFLAPSFASASWWDGSRPDQLQLKTANANPSVLVHVVDPASPSTSSVVTPSSLGQDAAEAWDEEDEDNDSPNFGKTCEFASTFASCGDYFDGELDHGLFCSPSGVCGGKGAACGASEACGDGLVCNPSSHRCVAATAKLLSIENDRRSARRKAAYGACPEGAQACSSGVGGFQCVHVLTDDQECGGCLGFGGQDCSAISNGLATSCRAGSCRVHACTAGYRPSEDGTECIDDMFFA